MVGLDVTALGLGLISACIGAIVWGVRQEGRINRIETLVAANQKAVLDEVKGVKDDVALILQHLLSQKK